MGKKLVENEDDWGAMTGRVEPGPKGRRWGLNMRWY